MKMRRIDPQTPFLLNRWSGGLLGAAKWGLRKLRRKVEAAPPRLGLGLIQGPKYLRSVGTSATGYAGSAFSSQPPSDRATRLTRLRNVVRSFHATRKVRGMSRRLGRKLSIPVLDTPRARDAGFGRYGLPAALAPFAKGRRARYRRQLSGFNKADDAYSPSPHSTELAALAAPKATPRWVVVKALRIHKKFRLRAKSKAEAVDPEERKLRLRKLLDYSKRHQQRVLALDRLGNVHPPLRGIHARRADISAGIVSKFLQPRGSRGRKRLQGWLRVNRLVRRPWE